MRHTGHPSQAAQRGQALVLGMLLAGLLSLALMRYFVVGQVAAARARQLHALDAAAYSGALMQARALNMLSHINRSQVAHQVAMAHVVTLASWAAFGSAQASRLARGNPPAYLIAMQFGPAHGAAYRAAARAAGLTGVAGSHAELAMAYAAHERTVHDVLARSQDALVAGLARSRDDTIRQVLALNYPGSKPGDFALEIRQDSLPGYLQRFQDKGMARQGLRELTMIAAGHYRFLASRDDTAYNPWLVQPGCPHLRHELRRRGATRLNRQGIWQSADTQSFHALRAVRRVLCYYREYPMAWGWVRGGESRYMSGQRVQGASGLGAPEFWDAVRRLHGLLIPGYSRNLAADRRARAAAARWQGRGLPHYYDIPADRALAAMRFGLVLRRAGPDETVIVTEGTAETFFDRPVARADGRFERPHLFQPYWQARLAPVVQARRPE